MQSKSAIHSHCRPPTLSARTLFTAARCSRSWIVGHRFRRFWLGISWGDAIYLVFHDIAACGRCSLLLSDLITKTDWTTAGLPRLGLRTSLHCAPLFPVIDPVSGLPNFTGCHTSRAARIEPITPPGQVYCSEAFATVSSTLGITDYECAYVGRRPLAKKYGDQPLYHVSQRREKRMVVAGAASDRAPAPAPALASSTAGAVVSTMTNMVATASPKTGNSFDGASGGGGGGAGGGGVGNRRRSAENGPDPLSGHTNSHPWSKQSRQQSFPDMLMSPITRARRSLTEEGPAASAAYAAASEPVDESSAALDLGFPSS